MKFTMTLQRGFTLIELMIAITLGLAIVLVATAGFRVAAQAVTKCNRMALENALVRTAVLQACNEVDYWTFVDNPEISTTPLRAPSPFGGWKPLTPFAVAGLPGGPFVIPGDERQTTWNPSPMAWAAHDPRAWCRGNMAETLRTDLRYGDYNLVANDQSLTNATSYDPFRCRSWYDNQLKTSLDSLGFYGTLEYLPSNVLFVYHGSQPFTANPAGLNSGFMPNAIISGGTRGWLGMTFQTFSAGRFRTTDAGAIPFANDKPILSSTSNTNDPFRSSWTVGYGGYATGSPQQEAANFHRATAFGGDLLTQHPQHWPHVTVRVERFIRQSRAINICIIDITDPITGQTSTIPFSTRGTTLRGARLQRTSIAGQSWSTYDNTDPLHPIIGASLDFPTAITY
jgi:prepilin-type N-terminal cleavage/methylation domain-containing protein